MQAIVLVGGFGTRLKSVVPDLPKPMAPIGDKPFLAHLLDYLQSQGITSIIFPVHYRREVIQDYFKSRYGALDVQYVEETTPLGTGGAIANALKLVDHTGVPVFVLNGDTFARLDYQAMYRQHINHKASLTIALRAVENASRYGRVTMRGVVIDGFNEKGWEGAGLINAGVYLLQPDLFLPYRLPDTFSFETDFIQPNLGAIQPNGFLTEDYFIDIGIPEDYQKALANKLTAS